MFNKREHEQQAPERSREHAGTTAASPARGARTASAADTAVIGPSISINGELKGQEDLVVEGQIEGTVELKQHTLTVGSQGTIKAQVYAHTILVDGTVSGDLYASEQISIRKSARIEGNILAPRISLEDGAKFRGSIDMDAESEAFRKVFQPPRAAGASTAEPHQADKKPDSQATDKPGASGSPASASPSSGSRPGKPTTSTA